MSMATIFINCGFSDSEYAVPRSGEGSNAQVEIPLMGKIVETMNGGGYTYILLQTSAKQVWVAIREMKVNVGQEIALMPGIEMTNFTSKSVNRIFESIIFSDGPISQQGSAADQDHASHGGIHGNADSSQESTAGSKGAAPHSYEDIKIDKAAGPNAYTIVELFEKKSELNQKEVVIRGQVVKVSPQIMGKNWLHVQDGTGYPQNDTNDIVVTTGDLPSVGDVVIINGVLYADKDFGSGYRYDAIIEQAHVTK